MIRRCPYRRQLVEAASTIVHGHVEPDAQKAEVLAHGMLYLDIEMAAVQIDLGRVQSDLESAKIELGALRRRLERVESS